VFTHSFLSLPFFLESFSVFIVFFLAIGFYNHFIALSETENMVVIVEGSGVTRATLRTRDMPYEVALSHSEFLSE
jgi:hypothetical protein